jgi:hypothetical protein
MTQLTSAQQDTVTAVIALYGTIKGNYADSMLEGIAHAFCDSGILTDALSKRDWKRLKRCFKTAAIDMLDLQILNNCIQAYDGKGELDCCAALALLSTAQNEHVDTETLCAYMWEMLAQHA